MYKGFSKIGSTNNLMNYLLYAFLVFTSLNPIFSYYLRLSNLHTITMVLIFVTTLLQLSKRKKIRISRTHINVYIYLCVVVLGVLTVKFNINFVTQALFYRIAPPMLFAMFFSLHRSTKSLYNIGYNVLKMTNVLSIIIASFGLIEKMNPTVVHKFYGNTLTPHMTLWLNGNLVRRLISLTGNPINLGFYMAIGLGSSLILILMHWKKSKYFVFFELLNSALFIYIMFLTYSRAAILASIVMVASILILILKNTNIGYKIGFVFVMVCAYYFLTNTTFKVDDLQARISTISWESFLSNTRYFRAYKAFGEDTHFLQYIFGHGIYKMNDSNAFVFELGYASLLYESGLLGFIVVIGCYVKGILLGIKVSHKSLNKNYFLSIFYTATIISGLSGMFVEDLYMQMPFSLYLWFSTFFILSGLFTVENKL